MMNNGSTTSYTKIDLAFLVLVLGVILGVYFPVLTKLINDWGINDNYSHGFFVPFISAYMIFSIREKIKEKQISPANWGLLILLGGFAQLYLASVGSELFLQRTSLIIVLLGYCLFLLGVRITWVVMLPLVYLIFMVPLPAIIWNKIAFPLQLFSSQITEYVIRLAGIPILREGNVLHLASTSLEVVDACSGLRSLNTMFALSIAFAWFSTLTKLGKWLLFFAAAPIAITANMVRLTLTAFLAAHYGEKAAQGFLHEFSGMFTFILGLLLLILVRRFLPERKQAAQSQ
ncbi:exosortase/archaeosortase family protein [Desulfogranum japonicum]|uniref:exosortase/archaeosortase family protein n=1 Tax=Desulfogranum japonicum TaxID=231447 RepID=UPI0004078C7F|nr:exosortase/archaeosortase family protein [Desulfogranum japonicum]